MADYLLKDHKPSATQGEARLRELYWIMYSKTIISVYTPPAAGASRNTADRNNGQCILTHKNL
jgi:hypothetical protein